VNFVYILKQRSIKVTSKQCASLFFIFVVGKSIIIIVVVIVI